MSTETSTIINPPSPTSRLVSSTSSLSSQQQQPPNVVRIYKQASQLFLTRRVREALDLLEPIIRLSNTSQQTNDSDSEAQLAPIASGSRAARVKVWNLYISILNETIEMGAEEGKHVFGVSRWKELVAKARDGTVWDEVIANGYGGVEGDVDADVIATLAKLALSHAPSQQQTQQRLESYLAASDSPRLDIVSHMQRVKRASQASSNGTSTPRDLNNRLRILEIYILHVLPQNEQWDYAREFVTMSHVLDEEKREAFLQALQVLQDEKTYDSKREDELRKQRIQQVEDAKKREAAAVKKTEEADLEEKRRRQAQQQEQQKTRQQREKQLQEEQESDSIEQDYGVDNKRPTTNSKAAPAKSTATSSKVTSDGRSTSKAATQPARPPPGPAKKPKAPPPTLYRRATLIMSALQRSLLEMGSTFRNNPSIVFRFVAFVIALLLALARQDVRDRINRIRETTWNKLRETAGMGVKVSYI